MLYREELYAMTDVSDFIMYSCSGFGVICIQERWANHGLKTTA